MVLVVLLDMFLPISTNGAIDMKNHSDSFDQLAALAEQNIMLRGKNDRLMQLIRQIASRLPQKEEDSVLLRQEIWIAIEKEKEIWIAIEKEKYD